MKIEEIKLVPADKYLFVQIFTDEGIVGLGEIGAWGFLDATAGAIEKFKGYLINQDPLKIEHHWQYMYRSLFFRGSVVQSAIAAIDIALWDIKGKHLGVPVYQLMGGKCREKVRTYVPIFKHDAEAMAEGCRKAQGRGYTAARLIIPTMQREPGNRDDETFNGKIEIAVDKIRACREAVGSRFDLCVEVHRSMSVAEAITFAREIEKYNPYFIEDPIAPDNMDAMVEVAQKTRIPIATCERAITIQEFEALLARRGAQYVRPDVCAVGGLTAAKKIASIAEAHYVGIVPHNPLGPVSTAACLQLDACIPNFAIQEYPSFNFDGEDNSMVKTPLVEKDGYLFIPDAPGIGVELVDNVTELFPPKQRDLAMKIAIDGSVADR
jgi:galactonate dehydratase